MITPFSGVALLDKAEGETSFSALGALKRQLNTRRVGHTGTLDPMATGLLVALVGPATRCARYFSSLEKVYVAEVTFGSETDTDDQTGRETVAAPVPDMALVSRTTQKFVGRIAQVPPAYSAVHVNGQRAYRRARAGESVTIPPRHVTVHEISCERISETTLQMTVRCTSGTYIRSLARDIGRESGSAAHLSALRRTLVGPFRVEEASGPGIQESGLQVNTLAISDALLRLDDFSKLQVGAETARTMWNGGRVRVSDSLPPVEGHVLATSDNCPVCVGRWNGGVFEYDLVFPPPEDADD